jgi:hypothetical protein
MTSCDASVELPKSEEKKPAVPPDLERPSTPQYPQLSPARLRVIFVALGLALMLAILEQAIVSTAIAAISSDLRGGSDQAYISTAYILAFVAALPVTNRLR